MSKQKRHPRFYACGGCECYHPVWWEGDCRDDAHRFDRDRLDAKYPDQDKDGWPDWEEVDEPDWGAEVEHEPDWSVPEPKGGR